MTLKNGAAGANGSAANSTGRALVVCPLLRHSANERDTAAKLAEATGLAAAIRLNVVDAEAVRLDSPKPATLLGKGAVERLGFTIAENDIGIAVVDGTLSPVQQRNLERAWKCKVIDRTGLILEIFGDRARTSEGRLQVELASLTYQKSRLVRSWTHLERQRGGFGFLGGPGEFQIRIRSAADRRPYYSFEARTAGRRSAPAACIARRESACLIRSWRLSATPMLANRHCLTG